MKNSNGKLLGIKKVGNCSPAMCQVQQAQIILPLQAHSFESIKQFLAGAVNPPPPSQVSRFENPPLNPPSVQFV